MGDVLNLNDFRKVNGNSEKKTSSPKAHRERFDLREQDIKSLDLLSEWCMHRYIALSDENGKLSINERRIAKQMLSVLGLKP